MDCFAIARRAWDILWRYRIVGWLALISLLAEGSGGYLMNIYRFSFGDDDRRGLLWLQNAARTIQDVIVIWFPQHWVAGMLLLLTMVGLFLALTFLGFSARGGLMLATQEIENDIIPKNVLHHLGEGRPFFWRLLGMRCLLGLLVLCGLFIELLVMAAVLLIPQETRLAVVVTVLCGGLLVVVSFIVMIGIAIVGELAERRIVLANSGIRESLRHSYEEMRNRAKTAFLAWLVATGIQFMASTVLSMIISIPAFVIVVLLVTGSGIWIDAVIGICAAITILGVLGIALLLAGFMSSYWTLVYRAFVGEERRVRR